MADQRLTNFLVLFGTFFFGDVYIIDEYIRVDKEKKKSNVIPYRINGCGDKLTFYVTAASDSEYDGSRSSWPGPLPTM